MLVAVLMSFIGGQSLNALELPRSLNFDIASWKQFIVQNKKSFMIGGGVTLGIAVVALVAYSKRSTVRSKGGSSFAKVLDQVKSYKNKKKSKTPSTSSTSSTSTPSKSSVWDRFKKPRKIGKNKTKLDSDGKKSSK